jgi:hypothetical protein
MNHRHPLRLAPLAVSALCGAALLGCDFVDAASELTAGAGEVPRVTASVSFPAVGRFVAARPGGESVAGVTSSLDGATLAHLAGLLRLDGTCVLEAALDAPSGPVVDLGAQIVLCDPARPCGDLCPASFSGAIVELSTTVGVLDEEDAARLRGQINRLSEDAIVQIRMRVHALELEDTGTSPPRDLMPLLSSFGFQVASDEAPAVDLVQAEHLAEITPETPRRFELPARAPLTRALKRRILAAEPFDLQFRFRFEFPASSLYAVTPGTARWQFDVQPEFVLSVVEAVEGG